MIIHADRFKTSRTNAEQNESCDVGREKEMGEGSQRQEVNNGEAKEGDERDGVLREFIA